MTATEFKAQLATRVKAAVDGTPPDPATISDSFVEQTRREYGRHRPFPAILPFDLASDEVWVDLPAGEDVVAIEGAYQVDLNAVGSNRLLPSGDGTPSLQIISAIFRGAYQAELEVQRYGQRLYLIREHSDNLGGSTIANEFGITPVYHYGEGNYAPYGANDAIAGVVVYHRLPAWEEIPEGDIPLLLKYALSDWIDQHAVTIDGRIRIPTGHGYFEFDGGSAILRLSQRLRKEFYDELLIPTAGAFQG